MVKPNPQHPDERKVIEAGDEGRRFVDRLRSAGSDDVLISLDGRVIGQFRSFGSVPGSREALGAAAAISELGTRSTLGGLDWRALREEGRR